MNRRPNDIYEFGECRLDPAERVLLRAGTPVSLTPKVFDTLLVLVNSGGRLVRKDELIKEVWPDAVVEEANLARNVWTLRRALGEGNGGREYIETVPKVGYRFVAPVRLVGPEPAPMEAERTVPGPVPSPPSTARRPRALWAATLAAAFVVVVGVIAFWWVRPQAASTESGIQFLSDGSQPDVGPHWGVEGRIHFSRLVGTTRTETWQMGPDGSAPRRANSEITSLLTGRWSPDGKRVVFTKEDDAAVVYVAASDGSNEVRLPFLPGNLDWSPEGSRFVYQFRSTAGTPAIAMYVVETGTSTVLSSDAAGDADPSFSPDGARVAFTSWRDGNAEIYIMNADGSNVRRMTNHPAFDNFPVFSPDGTQLAFQSNREDEHVEIYLLNVTPGAATAAPIRLTRSSTMTGLVPGSWSSDGTELLVYTNQDGQYRMAKIGVDPYPARLFIADPDADLSFPRVSFDGKRLVHEARLADRSIELRVTDLATARTRSIFRTAPGLSETTYLAPAWSPEGNLLAFSYKANGNSEIFAIRPDGTGLRNLTRHALLDSTPVFTADGREIVFARDEFGRAQLYRMDLEGEGQRRVTSAGGYELHPALSRDGRLLAFAGDREARGFDIRLIDLSRPSAETVLAARRLHDTLPAFSPDGWQVSFVANSDGNPEIYIASVNDGGVVRITRDRAEDTAPQFMAEGRRLIFSSNRGGRFALYHIDLR